MNHIASQTKHKKSIKALIIIIFFIIADILCENFIVIINDTQSYLISTVLLFAFLLFQILFSPIQAGFSDAGRKKGLIISLAISILSVICIFLFIKQILSIVLILFIATGLKGIWGNTLPIAWAAIADTQAENNRGSYALASGAYAVSYLILIALNNYSLSQTSLVYSILIILIIAFLLVKFKFKDPEDFHIEKDSEIEKVKDTSVGLIKHATVFYMIFQKEKSKIIKDIKDKATRHALTAYLLWSISMYSILISQIDLKGSSFSSNYIAIAMMIGYLIGVAILKLKHVNRIRDSRIIKWGYFISFISLIPYFLFFPFLENITLLLGICYFLHALGNSFLSPAFLALLSKEKLTHEQGKILGLIESSDSAAFMLSLIFVIIYNYLQFKLPVLVSFSFLSFVTSFVYYNRFKDKDDKINNIS